MENKTFEQNLKELETIITKLEDTNIDLLEGVDLYSKGLELAKSLHQMLEESKNIIVEKRTSSGLEKFEIKE